MTVDGTDVTTNPYTFNMPNHDVVVSATFEALPQGNVEWVLTAPSALVTGDEILIVDRTSKTAMSNHNGTGKAPSALGVTLSTDESKVTAGVADNIKWTVTNDEGTFKFAIPGQTTNYLYCTNANNGLRVGTNNANTFVITTSDEEENFGVDYLTATETAVPRYIGVYISQDWRSYDAINAANIKNTVTGFYKKVQSGAHTITVDNTIQHGTVETDELSGSQGDEITITVTPDAGYELTALDYNGTSITPTAGNAVSNYTFTMPDADVTIHATFSLISYTISIDNSSSGGSITTTPSGSATMGQEVTVNVTPSSGKKVSTVSYTVEGSSTAVDITPTNGAYKFEMPAANVTVTATFIDDNKLYILGMVNGNGIQPNQGVRMDYDGTKYTANIWVIGNSDNEMGIPGSWFAFTTVLANDNDNGGWNYVNANRYEPKPTNNQGTEVGDSYWWLANGNDCVNTNIELANRYWVNAFLIPAGLYTVEVTPGTTWKFSLTEIKDFTPAITPEGGEVVLGTTATASISENFNTFIASCNPVVQANGNTVNITPPVAKFFVNNELVNGTSKEIALDAIGETTVTAKCGLYVNGTDEYAAKTKSETYDVYQPYSATIASGFSGGTVSFSSTSTGSHYLSTLREGSIVRVYVTEETDFELESLTYTVGEGEAVDFIESYNNEYYSFVMPAGSVTINASFNYIGSATETTYMLVTSNNELEIGKKYLIVNENAGRALGVVDNSGNRGVHIEISNNTTTVSPGSDVSQFVLGSYKGVYTFKRGDKYLSNPSSTTVNQTGEMDENPNLSDNIDWSISISDNGNTATLQNGGTNRIHRYWGGSKYEFRAYEGTNGSSIQLYKEVTPATEATLAEIIALGENADGKKYKIKDSDGLLGVYKNGKSIWFKDEAQAVDYQDPLENTNYKYYTVVEQSLDINKSEKDFAQNNWIEVVFQSDEDNYTNAYVANLTGTYSWNNGNPNLTLTVDVDEEKDIIEEVPSTGSACELNPYIAANFTGSQSGTIQGVTSTYFFSKPKAQEYAQILWAVWDGSKFNMPTTNNAYGFTGSFTVSDELNGGVSLDGLQQGETYNFKAVIRKTASKAGYEVYPTDLNPNTIVTAIDGVEINGNVKSIKYVNVAGMVSDTPFQGVNIVVIEKTDGSKTTYKMIKK